MNACEWELLRKRFDAIDASIADLKVRIKQTEDTLMSQLDDLNAAIAAEDVEIQDLLSSITKVAADIDTLIAKIGTGTPPVDLTVQLQALSSHLASLTTGAQQLKDADTKANA